MGIAIAPSIADLVAESDVILSSLANDAAVRSVYLDRGRRLFCGKAGNRHSRNEHDLARTIAPPASGGPHGGINFLDVAISGSTPAVEAGTITLLAGGDKETFEQCAPYLRVHRQAVVPDRSRFFRRPNETSGQPSPGP